MRRLSVLSRCIGGSVCVGILLSVVPGAYGWDPDTDLSTADASFLGEDVGDQAGLSVSCAGDVNGDGYDDFLIGANGDDDGGSNAGQTYLILGKSTGWVMDTDLSTADASFIGEDADDKAGYSASGVGDVNGDGYDDFLIGAPNDDDGGANAGQAYLILGKASGWVMDTDLSAADASFIGEDADDRAAVRVSGAGDVNGDGYDDFLIGAPNDDDGGANAGQAYLILGKASGWAMDTDLSTADASFIGEDTEDRAGWSVSGVGDVNGDGHDDILIGAFRDDDGGTDAGQAYLILGKSSGWSMDTDLSTADVSFIGEDTNDFSGYSVSGAGDVDGDGCDDFLIGAPEEHGAGAGEGGQAYLVLSDYVVVSIPDTVASYADTIQVPVHVDDITGRGIVGIEISVAYDSRVVNPGSPDRTEIIGSMIETGWSIEDNVFPGAGGIDTLVIAMSTGQDTLSGAGDLVYLVLVTSDIRHPDSTALELVHVLFNDGSPPATTEDGSLKLVGTDGVVATSPDSIYPRQTVTITVDDVDEDRSASVIDSFQVMSFDVTYSDSQSVWVVETGVSSGVFTGTVDTEFEGVGGISFDGVLGVIAGDTVYVSYTDSLTAAGTTEERVAFTEVVGGVDGVLEVTYVVQALDGRGGLRDTVRARVTESGFDFSAALVDTAVAVIDNDAGSEVETVQLPETGVDTGIFRERVQTEEGTSGTSDNGMLTLPTTGTELDTLETSYVDTLTAVGGVDTLEAITYVVNMFGDVSGNDRVGAFDAAYALAFAVGFGSPTFRDSLVADVSGENEILAWDASLILQYVVRLINRFPVQSDTVFGPGDPKNHPFLKSIAPDRLIALGDVLYQEDGTYLLPVELGERAGILSGTLRIGYDPGVDVVDVVTADAYGTFMLAHNAQADGIRIAFAGSECAGEGPGEVLFIRVRATDHTRLRFRLEEIILNGYHLRSVPSEMEMPVETPGAYALHPNLPNPFNPQTTIRYELPEASSVSLTIYNLMGQPVRVLVDGDQEAGSYRVVWDGKDALGRDVSSGVYVVWMRASSFVKDRKMLLLR